MERGLYAYQDQAKDWVIIGALGDPLVVQAIDEVERIITDADITKASKVRVSFFFIRCLCYIELCRTSLASGT